MREETLCPKKHQHPSNPINNSLYARIAEDVTHKQLTACWICSFSNPCFLALFPELKKGHRHVEIERSQ
jgi:hypothetical protein